MSDTITIGSGSLGSYSTASMNYGNVTISSGGTSSGQYMYSTGSSSAWGAIGSITTAGTNTPSLKVTGEAEFESDIKIKGISIVKTLDEINKRLAILVPDPDKLEHFEALKKAYDHYKLMEALCQLPKKESE